MVDVTASEALNAAARSSLSTFTQKAFRVLEPSTPYEHNWHIDCISEHLEAVWNKDIRLLCINMPPRSLKTFCAPVSFASWGLGKDPSVKFMLTSYKHNLAESMTRSAKMLIKSDWYRSVFPNTEIAKDQDQKAHFETTKMGQYYSASMSSVTGKGCDIQICDDPLNPNEAISDTIRNSTNETIRGTLFSRFNDPRTGRFILIMQRLHDDDPSGNLMADMGWTHLKLPAEAIDKSYHIMLGNKEWTLEKGDLLFPERLTREVLDEKRMQLGEYNYAGQYLQEPVPLAGGELQSHWVQYYEPGRAKSSDMNIFILVDPSGGESDSSDWTAMMVVGLAQDNNYYLLDIVRDRLNPTERIDTLFLLHRKWNELTGKPPKVGYEKYALMTDTHYMKKKMGEENYRFPLVELGGRMKKEDRIRRIIPDLQNGRWYFPTSHIYVDSEDRQFDLVHELVHCEMKSFPRAKFDDMIDALSRIYDDDLMARFPLITSIGGNSSYSESNNDWTDW